MLLIILAAVAIASAFDCASWTDPADAWAMAAALPFVTVGSGRYSIHRRLGWDWCA